MKNTNKVLSFLAIAGIALASCGKADFKKTKSGVAYKIYTTGNGEKIKHGDNVKLQFEYRKGDSVLMSNIGHISAYGTYDTAMMKNTHDFVDFLSELRVGDSAVFTRLNDTLIKMGAAPPSWNLKPGGKVQGVVRILGKFKDQADMQTDYAKEIEAEKAREIADLQKYLATNKINATKTPAGVFVLMETPGTGEQVDSGKTVAVMYRGYLKNKKVFDSNMDSTSRSREPLMVAIGQHAVIPGWEEGLKAFKAGGKGKLYIPAMLAYGPQPQGEEIPALSDLIFDIEIVSVKPTAETTIPQGH